MSTQKDIIGAMKQQTSGPSRRALIASGVATSTPDVLCPLYVCTVTRRTYSVNNGAISVT